MRNLKRRTWITIFLSVTLMSCSDEFSEVLDASKLQMNLTGQLVQENVTRANDLICWTRMRIHRL